jgi:hypothetical protein
MSAMVLLLPSNVSTLMMLALTLMLCLMPLMLLLRLLLILQQKCKNAKCCLPCCAD